MKDLFIELLQVSLGTRDELSRLPSTIEWQELSDKAQKQTLAGFITEGMERLPLGQLPPKDILYQLIGNTIHSYEQRFEHYRQAIAELVCFYKQHGIKMMILKGYALSINWPKPEHRPCGDIDIWLFGMQKEADALIAAEKGIIIDNTHHHHTIFYWKDFMVENHYDFLNIHHHKSNRRLEEVLKKLSTDDSHFVDIYGERAYLPSPNLHALFLLRHAMAHFAATELTLRQILDWAFFVTANGKDIDWKWLLGVLEEYGMIVLFHIFNEICVDDLGFEKSLFPESPKREDALKARVLNEILSPVFSGEMPGNLFLRVIWKFRRWKANGWKHKLCYKESMWSAFWSGVWNHILKPASI